ncbi:hypothetical protein GCM10007385_25780 [Tateyamaria omphalii]|nr:hypothetical protein GCM10007385_25780 [Tateyamaria omphalii]
MLAERALYQAERLHKVAAKIPNRLTVITTRNEMCIEGAHALEGEMANLDRLKAAGHRIIVLQHFFDKELGGPLHCTCSMGLTDFGRDVVAEIEVRGMVLDLAHASPAVAQDVLTLSDMPVIVSHTGLHGAAPSPAISRMRS